MDDRRSARLDEPPSLEVIAEHEGCIEARVDVSAGRTTPGAAMPRAQLLALAAEAGELCAGRARRAGSQVTHVDSVTQVVRDVRSGVLAVRATVIDVSPTVVVVEVDIERDDGRLVARTTQTYLSNHRSPADHGPQGAP